MQTGFKSDVRWTGRGKRLGKFLSFCVMDPTLVASVDKSPGVQPVPDF